MDTETPAAVDLTGSLPQMTFDYHVLIPGSNKRLGWVVTFGGPSHPRSIAASNEASRKELLKSQRMEAARVNGRKYKPEDVQPEESTRDFVSSVVSRIVTWSPVKLGSQTIEFTDKAAVDLLIKPEMGPYLSQFVDVLTNEVTFMPDSAKD